MLNEHHPPAVTGQAEQPVVLITTPEIVSLPPNMGNLAHVISTQGGGGLADISASLVAELDRQGLNVHVAVPEYQHMFQKASDISHREYETIKRELNDLSRIHLVEDDLFAKAEYVYNDDNPRLDKIDLRRANAFQRGIISRLLPELKFKHETVLVHCNDWMTGLIPAAARAHGMKSLMTFHNIFTAKQWPKGLQKHSIDIEPFWRYLYFEQHPDKFGGTLAGNYENNSVDFMTSGLVAADYINTVSPTFLKEIVEWYFAEHHIIPDHMRQIIRRRYTEKCATGILNAPAESADPRVDPLIVQNYWYEPDPAHEAADLETGKQKNKKYFQKITGLVQDETVPLFFWPSRIADPQKGFDLFLSILPYLLNDHNLQVAVVASGDGDLINRYRWFEARFPGRVLYRPFSRSLSQVAKAAADFILMPSLYEPCGIPQVEAPRYATIPIVRRTGGLADTVEQLSPNGLIGNGFVFDDFIPGGLWFGINCAMNFYKRDQAFKLGVLKRIMRESFEKFNIQKTAYKYIAVYEEILRQDPKRPRLV
jgi:ADP-glucose type glycogen/starch synthase